MNHSPLPWKKRELPKGVEPDGFYRIVDKDGRHVATVPYSTPTIPGVDIDGHANLEHMLLADNNFDALLGHLQYAAQWFNGDRFDDWDDEDEEWLKRAKAAIAAATPEPANRMLHGGCFSGKTLEPDTEQCEWWCYGIRNGRLFLNCRKCGHRQSATNFSRVDRDRAQRRPFEQFRYSGAVDPISQLPIHYSPGPMCGTAGITEKMSRCRIVDKTRPDTEPEPPVDTPPAPQ